MMSATRYLTVADVDAYLKHWASVCGPKPPKRGTFLLRKAEYEAVWESFWTGASKTRRLAITDPIALRVDMAMRDMTDALPMAARELRARYGLVAVKSFCPAAKVKPSKWTDIGFGFLIARIKPYRRHEPAVA